MWYSLFCWGRRIVSVERQFFPLPLSSLFILKRSVGLVHVLTDGRLAYAEMRLILARILYAFDLELVNKDVDWFDQKVGTLWEKPPLPVYLTPVSGVSTD